MVKVVRQQQGPVSAPDKGKETAPPANSNSDPALAAARGRALTAVGMITERWKLPAPGVFDLDKPVNPAFSPAAFRTLTYRLASEGAKNGMNLDEAAGGVGNFEEQKLVYDALGGDPVRKPYQEAFAQALDEQQRDTVHMQAIGRALDDLMHGGDVKWNTKDLLGHYAPLSSDGKKWLAKSPKTIAFKKYVTEGKCAEHGALEATHMVEEQRKGNPWAMMSANGGGQLRISACTPIVGLLDHGAMGAQATEDKAADSNASTTSPDGQPQPDPIEAKAQELLARISVAIKKHSSLKHEERTIQKDALKGLIDEVKKTDDKVKERLFAKPELMQQLMQLEPGQMKTLVAKLDTVQGLFETLVQWAPASHAQVHDASDFQHPRIELNQKVYPTIEAFLIARPGKENAAVRMRVLQHEQLKSLFIDNCVEEQRKKIYKLVASGTLEPSLVDKLRDAARDGNAVNAARALMKLGNDSPEEFGPLRDDHIFRKEIEKVDKEVTVDGFQVNAYHLCLTFWGLEPLATKDATVAERQQELNPDGKVGPDGKPLFRPLTIEERIELETKLLDPYAKKLRSEIHERIVDDDDMRDICRGYERDSAAYIKSFQAMGQAPGPALTEYYNKKYHGHDLRGEVNEYVSDSELVECERILGFRANSATVGIIGGQIQEHGEGKAEQKDGHVMVGLDQALRETFDDKGNSLSRRTSDYAQNIANWLYETQGYQFGINLHYPGVNANDFLTAWEKYSNLITEKKRELASKTTLAPNQIHAIEFLQNAVMEKGGDLAGKITRFYDGNEREQILREMGLRPSDAANRAKAANDALMSTDPLKGLEQQAKAAYAENAAKLFESISTLSPSLSTESLVPVAAAYKLCVTQKLPAAPETAGPKTASIDEGRPPKSFNGFYRLEYGIDPQTHITRVLKSFRDRGRDVSGAATLFSVEVPSTIEPPKEDELKIDDRNKHLVRPNFTEDTARTVARELWNAIHEGTRLNVVMVKLYTDFADEEQRLIRMAFRAISGGIDIQFYLQQKLLQKKKGQVLAGMNIPSHDINVIGGEATEEAKKQGASKKTDLKVGDTDANELSTAISALKEGTVDTYAMMKSAANNRDVDSIMRLADEAEQPDRAKILADRGLMDQLRLACDAVAWDRVYKTLTNQADLVDRLFQRGAGLGTDEKGMREDIKAHVRRLRKKFRKELQAVEDKKAPGQQKASPEEIDKAAQQKVREECQRLMSNISVRRIIDEELSSEELSEVESLIMNAGETTTQSEVLRDGNDAEKIIAGIRNTAPQERARLRGDARYLELLAHRLRDKTDYQKAIDALMSDRPGEDVLSKIDVNATKDKSRTMLRDLVDLSPSELKQLQADPDMQAKVLASFDDPEKRALARQIMSARAQIPDKDLPDDKKQDEADKNRTLLLAENARARIRVPCVDKLGWPTMLEECIEVYKMELEQRTAEMDEATGTRVLKAFSEKEAPRDRVQRERTAKELRAQIWHDVQGEVAAWAAKTEKDKPRRTLSEAWTAHEMISIVKAAVMHERDPSSERLKENIGATVDMPDGTIGGTRKVELDNDYDGIKKTISSASDQVLVNEWSNVLHEPHTGGPSLKQVWNEYKAAKDTTKPNGELEPTADAQEALFKKKMAFVNYTLDISTNLEGILLPHVGASDERKGAKELGLGAVGNLKERDNKKYNELLDLARGRIIRLSKDDGRFLIANAIHLDPANKEDWDLLDNPNRDTITNLAYRDSKYLRSRGTEAGSGWAAHDEAQFLDQRMMQYNHDVANAQTNVEGGRGMITTEEAGKAEEKGAEMERALQAFKDAKAKVAMWMSLIVGVLVTAVLTILTGGLATGPLAALFFTTAIAGVSAGAKALVNEAVLAEDYDLSDEGVKMIGKEMLTAFISAGTTMLAQKAMAGLAGVTKLGRQIKVMQQVKAMPPPMWREFLNQAGEGAIQAGMEGVVDAGLTAVDPVYWMHGIAEGRDRALPLVAEKINAVPMKMFKAGMTSLITSGVMRFAKKKELSHMAEDAKHSGGRVNIKENFKKVFGNNSQRVVSVFTGWAVEHVGHKIDIEAVPGELLESFLSDIQQQNVNMHVETANEHSRAARAEKDVAKYHELMTPSEREAFKEMHGRAQPSDPYVTVGEFLRTRNQLASDALTSWAERHPGKSLTSEQAEAFAKYVREAQDAEQFKKRLDEDPESIHEVQKAKEAKPDAAKAAAGTHVDGHHTGVAQEATKAAPVAEVRTVSSVEEGYALMRRLAGGDNTAAEGHHEGRTDNIEWGLGRKPDGTLVILKGKKGEVDFDHIPGIVALAHSHPAVLDGVSRDLAAVAKEPGGVPIGELMNDKHANDLVSFLPSTGDLGYFADNMINGHVVFTPYVHMGDGKVGNPNPNTPPGQRIEIVVNDAKIAGRSSIQKHQPAYEATIIIRTGDGQVLWTGPMYAVKVASGMFRADQPSLHGNFIEKGVMPEARPSEESTTRAGEPMSGDEMIAKYGSKPGDKHKPTETHAQGQQHNVVGQQTPGGVTAKPKTAVEVFEGAPVQNGEHWTFVSASGNRYEGTFQGIDATGHILLQTANGGIGRLDPARLASARKGPSMPELHEFGPHDRITLFSVRDNPRTGTIEGYTPEGHVIFKRDNGQVEILLRDQLNLAKTVRVNEQKIHNDATDAAKLEREKNDQAAKEKGQEHEKAKDPKHHEEVAKEAATTAKDPNAPVERNVVKDLPNVDTLTTLGDHVIGAHQAARVEAAIKRLPEAEYNAFRAIHDSLNSDVKKAFLLKALAAHNDMAALHWLAQTIAFQSDAWVIDYLTLGDPRGVGVGVRQQWSMSCNASTTLTLRGNYDPVFALQVRMANPGVHQVDVNDPMKWNAHQATLEANMLQSPYAGASNAQNHGETGVAVPIAQGENRGRWADDILSAQHDVTGMKFATKKDPSGAEALATIHRSVSKGMQVPIVIGNRGLYSHYVLVMAVRKGGGSFEYQVHNTGDGTTTWVSAEAIEHGNLPLLGGRAVTAIEVPTSVPHPDEAAKQAPTDAQAKAQPQDPAHVNTSQVPMAGASEPTRQMAAVSVADAPSIAATAVAVVSDQISPAALTAKLDPAPGPASEHKIPEAIGVPAQVQGAVELIMHGKAVHAAKELQAMEAKAAAATAHGQTTEADASKQQAKPGTHDAAYEQFTQEWKGQPADLEQFKKQFEIGYEDALDKVGRALSDPQVRALIGHVPVNELAAIVLYTQTFYIEMNGALRNRDKTAMNEYGNGIRLADKALSKMPVHQGWVRRGVEMMPADVVAKYVPGVVVTEEAFTSSSRADEKAFKGEVQFKILSKSGRDVQKLSRVEAEQEVLFRPGTKFVVVDKVREGDQTIITMEEVSASPGGPGGTGEHDNKTKHATPKIEEAHQTTEQKSSTLESQPKPQEATSTEKAPALSPSEQKVDKALANKLALILPEGASQIDPQHDPFRLELKHSDEKTTVVIKVDDNVSEPHVRKAGDHIEIRISSKSSDVGLSLVQAMAKAEALASHKHAGTTTAPAAHVAEARYLLARIDEVGALAGSKSSNAEPARKEINALLERLGVHTAADAHRIFEGQPELANRIALYKDGLTSRPQIGSGGDIATYNAESNQHLDALRSKVKGPNTDELVATERMALGGQLRLEGARRLFEPLEPQARSAVTALEPHKAQLEAHIDAMKNLINDANLSGAARYQRLKTEVEAIIGLGLPADHAAKLRQGLKDFESADGAGAGLVLDVKTGVLSGTNKEGGVDAPTTIRQLMSEVDAANQKAVQEGLGIQFVIVMHNPQTDAVGNSKAAVEVLSRPAPQYRVPKDQSPLAAAGNEAGQITVDVGVGRGAFAAEKVPESDRKGMIVQTDVIDNASEAQQHRYKAGVVDAGPSREGGAVVVFADVLHHPELMKPGPGDAETAGTKRMFLNNISAHYDQSLPANERWTGPDYEKLANGLAESMSEGGVIDIVWDMSPETVGGEDGSRGHIDGPNLYKALLATGREVHVEQASSTEGTGFEARNKQPIKPEQNDYTIDAGRSAAPDPSKLRGFVPPTPGNRWIIKFGKPLR